MTKNILMSLSLAFLLSACSIYQIESEENGSEFYPSKSSIDQVAYLETISREYEVIGQVRVNTERNQKTIDGVGFEGILARLKQEAAVIGGDAITNIHTDTGTGRWAKNKPQKLFGNANIRVNYMADVVVFK